MRLHNRQIKGAFWTDTDLIRELTPVGRMFYLGLIQIADDSGCLDDDLLAMKILLFPGDESLQVSDLSGFRKTLVSMGKLTPYLSGGKKCLFLRNFHKHQKLDTPTPPDVPLPEWMQWSPYKSNPRTGKYVVDWDSYKRLTCKAEAPYECLTDALQIPSNLEPRTLIDRQTARAREGWGAIVEAYFGWCGGTLGGLHVETLGEYYDKLGADMVVKAFTLAKEKDARQFSYVEKILAGWVHRGILTLADWERDEQQYQEAKQSKARQTESTGRVIPGVEATRKYLEEQRRQFEGGAASG